LIDWDLPEKIPALQVDKLFIRQGSMDDRSLGYWKGLPPLVRKAIAQLISDALGSP